MDTGKFITVEGIEGVGKSTSIGFLCDAIEKRGLSVLTTREPGGTPMAEKIRDLLIEHGDEAMPDIAELLLMFAGRALHVNNVIQPALAAGRWVICDRFTDASRAYQGAGRGFPQDDINRLAQWVHGDLRPDLTILEVERADFFGRARNCYLSLAEAEPDRFAVVDASVDIDSVRATIDSVINNFLDQNLD
jgi:dTMP kinase